jgi:hypothetical protein
MDNYNALRRIASIVDAQFSVDKLHRPASEVLEEIRLIALQSIQDDEQNDNPDFHGEGIA